MIEANHTPVEALRKATFENNLVWLESFGCKIKRFDNLIYINHPQLQDYSAWLVLGGQEASVKQVQNILADTRGSSFIPDIYIDEAGHSPSLESSLKEKGWQCIAINRTIASRLSLREVRSDITVKPVEPDNFDQWLALYAEGFNRHGKDAEVDRARWLRAFEMKDTIQYWFFARDNINVGICQTCTAAEIVGVYSFALRFSLRGVRNLRAAIRALHLKMTEGGENPFYLERLLRAPSRNRRRAVQASQRVIVVRQMLGYRRLSAQY